MPFEDATELVEQLKAAAAEGEVVACQHDFATNRHRAGILDLKRDRWRVYAFSSISAAVAARDCLEKLAIEKQNATTEA